MIDEKYKFLCFPLFANVMVPDFHPTRKIWECPECTNMLPSENQAASLIQIGKPKVRDETNQERQVPLEMQGRLLERDLYVKEIFTHLIEKGGWEPWNEFCQWLQINPNINASKWKKELGSTSYMSLVNTLRFTYYTGHSRYKQPDEVCQGLNCVFIIEYIF